MKRRIKKEYTKPNSQLMYFESGKNFQDYYNCPECGIVYWPHTPANCEANRIKDTYQGNEFIQDSKMLMVHMKNFSTTRYTWNKGKLELTA